MPVYRPIYYNAVPVVSAVVNKCRIDLITLIKISKELSYGETIEMKKVHFNKFERRLKFILTAILVSVIALYTMESIINNINCYGAKFGFPSDLINFLLLVSNIIIGIWFMLTAKLQTSSTWRRTRIYVRDFITNCLGSTSSLLLLSRQASSSGSSRSLRW